MDDMLFGTDARMHRKVLKSIERALRLLEGRFEIRWLSDVKSVKTDTDTTVTSLKHVVARLAQLNTTWFMRGESPAQGRDGYRILIEYQLHGIAMRVDACLQPNQYEYVLIPGGIYGSSGLWYEIAKQRGIRPVTYDSGAGVAVFSADGIASQLQDIPRAFEILRKTNGVHDWILSQSQIEFKQRQQGRDKFAYQISSAAAGDIADMQGILMALNSPWDSACLGLHSAFADTTEWIIETVRWVMEHTDETIIVRQHPAERFPTARSLDNVGKLLLDTFGQQPRIRFVAADSPINTYDLLGRVRGVLVHTSTLGVEAAMMGKVVITASNSYYADMGFVYKASSKEQYFELIRKQIIGELSVDKAKTEAATYFYYLGQCCNWIYGEFNVDNYPAWVATDIHTLYKLDEVQLILNAIDANIPISILQHEKKYSLRETSRSICVAAPSTALPEHFRPRI
jgi:hypothetical protein